MSDSKPLPGFFLTLEGGEGAGKSTQIKLLETALENAGYDVVSTREPGGTSRAERIRDLILSGQAEEFGPEFEATLFTAARLDHLELCIAPALAAGKVVICDRFVDSTRVYQGKTGNVPMNFLYTLEELVKEIAWPDMTLILDIDPELGMKRAAARRNEDMSADRFEKESNKIQQARRKAFLDIAKKEKRRCKVIDANGGPATVHDSIWNAVRPAVEKKLGKKNG